MTSRIAVDTRVRCLAAFPVSTIRHVTPHLTLSLETPRERKRRLALRLAALAQDIRHDMMARHARACGPAEGRDGGESNESNGDPNVRQLEPHRRVIEANPSSARDRSRNWVTASGRRTDKAGRPRPLSNRSSVAGPARAPAEGEKRLILAERPPLDPRQCTQRGAVESKRDSLRGLRHLDDHSREIRVRCGAWGRDSARAEADGLPGRRSQNGRLRMESEGGRSPFDRQTS